MGWIGLIGWIGWIGWMGKTTSGPHVGITIPRKANPVSPAWTFEPFTEFCIVFFKKYKFACPFVKADSLRAATNADSCSTVGDRMKISKFQTN